MSRIKVWTSKGNWSKEISGIDKASVIKDSLRVGQDYIRDAGEKESFEPHFEMDFKEVDDLMCRYQDGRLTGMVFAPEVDYMGVKLFMVPLVVLRKLAEIESSLSSSWGCYSTILDMADVPDDVQIDYCLLMEFENE